MKFSLVRAFAIIVNLATLAAAQEAPSSSITPCQGETVSRPTLKRRQASADSQRTAEQQTVVVSDARPCQNTGVEPTGNLRKPVTNEFHEPTSIVAQKPVTIEFLGLTAIDESEVRKNFRERRVNKLLDSGITGDSIAAAEALLKSLLSDYGYRDAQLSTRLDVADKGATAVTFLISEGPRFTISEIRFKGNRVFSEQLLATKIRECLARYDEDRREVYRSELFEYCTHRLANFERSQGYLQARFGKPKFEEVAERLVITVPVDEGVLYRVGALRIEGAEHVAEQDIRTLIDMRTGDIANGEILSKALYEKLKGVYGEKGFIQYTAEIEPEFRARPGASEGVVDFTITIDEGRRFRIRKIFFKGDVPENELRQLLPLREGDVYNQKLFEESVTKMNDTGWFEWVDRNKDVDYRTNEEEGLLDLSIKVKRRTSTN